MNDIKMSGGELAAKQGAATSTAPKSGLVHQGSNFSKPQQDSTVQADNAEAQKEQVRDVKQAVAQLNDYVQNVQRDLRFNLDDTSGKTVITVVDRRTSEVVRQIPDDVALKLAQELQQEEPLSLFNAKV